MALEIVIELDRIPTTKQEILGLKKGSPIVLLKQANEPCEILISGQVIGKGFIHAVDEKFVLEISEVIPLEERAGLVNFLLKQDKCPK